MKATRSKLARARAAALHHGEKAMERERAERVRQQQRKSSARAAERLAEQVARRLRGERGRDGNGRG